MPPPRPPIQTTNIKTISGLKGNIPTQWDAQWQLYTDLTPDQIAAFKAMPEWTNFKASYDAWLQNPVGSAPSLTVKAVNAAAKAAKVKAGAL